MNNLDNLEQWIINYLIASEGASPTINEETWLPSVIDSLSTTEMLMEIENEFLDSVQIPDSFIQDVFVTRQSIKSLADMIRKFIENRVPPA